MTVPARKASSDDGPSASPLAIGVLALQGGFAEHLNLVRSAAELIGETTPVALDAFEVRTPAELARCDALIIPGGESTTISLVAAQSGLLEPLRDFVRVHKKPTWGTCAGLILLSEQANATKKGGQELIGGLGVRVHRNHFGRQLESFEAGLDLPFLHAADAAHDKTSSRTPFPGVFIRAPVVEEILPGAPVEILALLPGRVDKMRAGVSQASVRDGSGDIIAVRQDNVVGTSFHPELTADARMHVWWLREVLRAR